MKKRHTVSHGLVQGLRAMAQSQAADGQPDCSHIRSEVVSSHERQARL